MTKFIFGEVMDYVKLGDLCVINSGGTPRRNNESYWKNGDIPWVKISDLNNGVVESTEEFITLDGLKNSSAKIFPQGTLLYTIFATIGEVAILNIDAATNQAIVGLQLKENQKVYLKYIYYYLKSQTNIIKHLGRGVAQNNINLSVVKNMIIPIVSLEKQSNIIATLSKLEKIKKNRIIISNYLDGLIKSRFVELFGDPVLNEKGWNLTSLESVCQSIYGGGTPSKKIKEYYMGTIPWVTSKDMKSDIIVDSIEHITQVAIDNSSTKIIPPESVLIVIRSGILKHTLPVCINKSRVTINQDLKALVLDERCKAIYLQYLLKALEKDILSGVRAVTADNIEFNSLKKRKIPIPPINKQIKFSQMVNQINKLKSDVQKSIDETQLLMNSLMQEYFG